METSNQFEIRLLEKEELPTIVPLLCQLNESNDDALMKQRVLEMAEQNYACVGIFDSADLIGICGLWFQTRHYSGRSIEADHVIIRPEYQGHGLGNKLFEWLNVYAATNGHEAIELNTYVENTRSHKFYYNLGYEILGFHFVKHLD